MIAERDMDRESSAFDMGYAGLVLNAGHGEYGIYDNERGFDDLKVTAWAHDAEDFSPKAGVKKLTDGLWKKAAQSDDWYDDSDRGWVTVLTVVGDVYYIAQAFYRLAMDLDPRMDPADYTPGGDDDTFDYWPSGMRLLYQLACNLDDLTANMKHRDRELNPIGDRYRERYREVLARAVAREVPEMASSVPEAEEENILEESEAHAVTSEPYEGGDD